MTRTKNTSQQKVKTAIRDKDKGRVPVKRVDLIPMKEATFISTPLELEKKLAIPEDGADLVADPEDLLDVDDADLEIVDEDETFSGETASTFEQYSIVYPGSIPDVADSPEVSPENVYPLVVTLGRDGRFFCSFEAPRWMYGRIPESDKKHISILRNFLVSLADWFEENKQDFLQNPTPENFVKNETCIPESCIVRQDDFVKRVNLRMPEHKKMTKSYLSRLYNKIWLFWPKVNMPLSAIFSDPYQKSFRRAWVIDGCLDRYAHASPIWREGRKYERFSTDELKSMEDRFDRLDPEEQLYLLCRTAKITKQIDMIYQTIIAKIDGKNHG